MKTIQKLAFLSALCVTLSGTVPVIPVMPAVAAEAIQTEGICGADDELHTSVTWKLEPETGTLTISGKGRMYNYLEDYDPTGQMGMLKDERDVFHPGAQAPWGKEIRKVVIGEGVISIGNYAFYGCKNLKSVSLPASLEEIECFAFSQSGIETITIPNGIMGLNSCAFYASEELETIDFIGAPNYIGDYAFAGCKALQSIKLPVGVHDLGNEVFSGCSALADISLPYSLTTIGARVFDGTPWLTETLRKDPFLIFNEQLLAVSEDIKGEIKLPNTIRYIGGGVFMNRKDITSVVIPDSVTVIGAEAFANCTGLQSAVLSQELHSIKYRAFYGCTALQSADFSERLHYIGSEAYRKCSSVTDVILPDGIIQIDYGAFSDCSSLRTVTVYNSALSFRGESEFFSNQDGKFTGIIIGYENSTAQQLAEQNGWKFESLGEQIPKEPPSENCGDHLKWKLDQDGTLTISGTGDMYDYFHFSGRLDGNHLQYSSAAPWGSDVKAVVIGDGVTSIGSGAFLSCSQLKTVSIPDTVSKIGRNAFYGCSSLTGIDLSDNIKIISEEAFKTTGLTALILPKKLKYIGDGAFNNCIHLTEIAIPNGTESIGTDAFGFCQKLTTVKLADSLISVGARAFEETPWLQSRMQKEDFVIENGVLLKASTRLNGDILIPKGVRVIGGEAFDNVGFTEDFDAAKPMTVTVPEGVVTIGELAFCWCSSMTAIQLPSTLETIEESAFFNCFALNEIELPERLKTIGRYSFGNCQSLKAITIPKSVELIDCQAFERCDTLETVTILNPHTEIFDAPDTFTNPEYMASPIIFTGVIRGYEGSTAQAYAKRYERRFEALANNEPTAQSGDISCDGTVDVADAVLLARFVSEDPGVEITETGRQNADINQDGKMDSEDAILILKYIAKLLPSL